MMCNIVFMCCQALQQSATCVLEGVKRKLEWDTDQLICEKVLALQNALQKSTAEAAELKAQLAYFKKAKIPCF